MKLECKQISLTYPHARKAIIEKLSFSIDTPGFHCLFGPSGVGKTSLARIIAGLIAQNSGQVAFDRLDTVFYSYNLERLPGWMSVGRHLEMVCADNKLPLKEQLVEEFEIGHVLSSRFSSLSMGQQNRVNLIRYLLEDFNLLIMDESLANVDEKLRASIISTIKFLFPEKMFLYISHHLLEVSRFCNQVVVLGKTRGSNACKIVNGLDSSQNQAVDQQEINRAMLEIMNAF